MLAIIRASVSYNKGRSVLIRHHNSWLLKTIAIGIRIIRHEGFLDHSCMQVRSLLKNITDEVKLSILTVQMTRAHLIVSLLGQLFLAKT